MLSSLTIAQAHAKLKKKEISSQELVQSCIDRIESVDGALNAVVSKNFDRALIQAKKIDSEGKFLHPLQGIPFLVKDVYCETGIPTTACSNVLRSKDYRPPFNATTVQRLLDAGAISLGKTNTDEFTCGGSTETSCYGVTRNPWNKACVAGGSSGGPASAVGADECIFALGTDTGGSIRQPASFCSCSGIRVTYGRTSRYGTMSMASSLDTTGPIAKTVEDLAIILETIVGHDPMDVTTADRPKEKYTAALTGNVKGLRIGLPKEYFIEGIDPEVEAAVRQAAKTFTSLGAKIVDISLPHTEYAVPAYYIICPSEVSSNMARFDGIRFGHVARTENGKRIEDNERKESDLVEYYKQVRTEGFGDEVKRRIMIGTYALSAGYYDAYYRQAQKVRTLIKKDFDEAFTKVDIILSPVSPTPAFAVGAHSDDPVAMYLEDVFTVSQSLAGIPCLSVPCGFSQKGLPIGVQMMGAQWQEATILNAASAYQNATQWHLARPTL